MIVHVDNILQHPLEDILRMKGNHELISISVNASVGDALKLLRRHNVLALPVYGQPHHWIASGEQADVIDRDKQYMGIVSILDILMFFTALATKTEQSPLITHNNQGSPDLPRPNPLHQADTLDSVSIKLVLGKSNENQSLWMAKPNDRLIDALEPLGKGIHRLLVPMPISESAGYHLLTQTDVTRFIISRVGEDPQLKQQINRTLDDLGLFEPKKLVCVDPDSSLLNALKGMAYWGINAIPLVSENPKQYRGTLSVSDLRMLPPRADVYELIEEMKKLSVVEFLERVRSGEVGSNGGVVVKKYDTLLHVAKLIVQSQVHRAWIVDESGIPVGVITFSDIISKILRANQ